MKSHRIRGGLTAGIATLLIATLMFLPRFFHAGIALGVLLMCVLVVGILDLLGAIAIVPRPPALQRDGEATLPEDAPLWLRWLTKFNIPLLYLGLSLFAAGACRISVIGTMAAKAPWTGPLFFALGAVVIVLARRFRKPFDGNLHQGLLVFGLMTATLMATLGSQGLWDCWETHYGEVARRQLEQDDWISLFWETEWFYSKPILTFWMMNFGMALFGVNIKPDRIPDHAEWGVRFSIAILAIAVILSVYALLSRRVSKRAGLFAALVLATMPLYGFMARQAITDLPFVGFMVIAVVLFLLGITAPKEALVKPAYLPLPKGRCLPLDAFHAVIAGYVLVGVSQFLYLATRSTHFVWGTLGQGDVRTVAAEHRLTNLRLSDLTSSLFGLRVGGLVDISLDWFLLGLLFAIPFFFILYTLRKERRVSKLCFHGMYICLALSVMAKGLPGLALPILALVAYWMIVAPWREIRHFRRFFSWHMDQIKRLDFPRGIPMFLLVASPWYLAMFVRHGLAFFNRFFIHDHLKRLSAGVHGESGSLQYFLEQFGYAAFPWAALFPLAILAWPALMRQPGTASAVDPTRRSERTIRLFLSCLAFVTFTLFSMMATKFHHYVFPILIPAAILIALFLNDIWEERVPRMGLVVLTAVIVLIAVAKDLVVDPTTKAKGVLDGHTQLVGLFIYKYERPYPEGAAYDFSTPLLIFAALFTVSFALWLYARRRRVAIVLTMLCALAFSHFIAQHYMVQLAPHWTQKHLIADYYAERRSPAERLIAFQMNWKGENFYTGNRVIAYVSTKNSQFEKWIEAHRGERHFFITEKSRFSRMSTRTKPESGALRGLADTCNKYRIGVAETL